MNNNKKKVSINKRQQNMIKRKKRKKRKKTVSLIVFAIIILLPIFYFINKKNKLSQSQTTPTKHQNNKSSNNKKEQKNVKNNKSSKNKKQTKNKLVKNNILINFAGDCTLGTDTKFGYANSLPYVLEKNGNDLSYFFKNVAPIFKNDDFTVVNLETTFTNSNNRVQKTFNFKGDKSYANSLVLGSIEAVNISNNHIFDYGKQGFEDTKNALKEVNVDYFGEGNVLIKNIKGQKFAFIGYQAWADTPEFLQKLKNEIELYKKQGAIVILNFHWGIEGTYEPYNVQENIAHFCIDNGADLIIGHHPHVVQPIEKYKDKIICYSLGNFCFGGNFNPRDKDTFILQVNFNFENNSLIDYTTKTIPCRISSTPNYNDYCPTPLEGTEATRVFNKINK